MECIQLNTPHQSLDFFAGTLERVASHLRPDAAARMLETQQQEFGYTGALWSAQSEIALLASSAGVPVAFGLLGLTEFHTDWQKHFVERAVISAVLERQFAQLTNLQFQVAEHLAEPVHRVRQLMVLPEHRGRGYLRLLLREIRGYIAKYHDQQVLAIFARAGMYPSAVGSSSSITSHELVPLYAHLGFSALTNQRGAVCCPVLSNRYYNVAMVQPISASFDQSNA